MRCPVCGAFESRVLDSRPVQEGRAIRRRRECGECSRRFTTYERAEVTPIVVIKKDGSREAFDRRKILNGLMKACEKRQVPLEVLENIVNEVERQLRDEGRTEVHSRDIGEMVISRLKGIDEVAYVRFASVYRQFADVSRFMDELEKLLAGR